MAVGGAVIDEPINNDVVRLKTERKEPPDGRLMLVPPPFGRCIHFNTSFEIDEDAGKCKCLGCGEEVSPMFVLKALMNMESRWMRTREAYQAEMRRLAERESTKCRHCGKMTRISNR
jgi:hypothetical protein